MHEIQPRKRDLETVESAPSAHEAPIWDAVYPYHRHEEGVLDRITQAIQDTMHRTEPAQVCVALEGMDSAVLAVAAARACEEYGVELILYTIGFFPGMPRALVHARAHLVAQHLDQHYETPVSFYHLQVPPPPYNAKRDLCQQCGKLRFEAAAHAFPGSLILGGANYGEAPHRAQMPPTTEHPNALEYRPLLDLKLDKGHVVAALREADLHFPRFEWWKNESGCGVRDYLRKSPDPDGVLTTAQLNDELHRALTEEGVHCGHHYDTAVVLYDGETAYPVLVPLPWGWDHEAHQAAQRALEWLKEEWELGDPLQLEPEDPPLQSLLKRARQLGTITP